VKENQTSRSYLAYRSIFSPLESARGGLISLFSHKVHSFFAISPPARKPVTAPATALSLGNGPFLSATLPFLSSREPVTFWHFRPSCTSIQLYCKPQQSRHPERSASQIHRITRALLRGVEGPRQCFLADALWSFPTANYTGRYSAAAGCRYHRRHPGDLARALGTPL
jgi:hypothetical protein